MDVETGFLVSFFDKMKDKVGPALSDATQKLKQGVHQVADAAGDKLTETRLRAQLKALHKERDEKFQALGLKAYSLQHGEGIGIDDLAPEMADLDELHQRIRGKQSELDAFLAGEGQSPAEPEERNSPG